MAGLTGDEKMIEDFLSGEPYLGFGKRATDDATKQSHREFRNKVLKPVVGQNYGMTPYGIVNKTGKSLRWARDTHAQHRHIYSVFHQRLDDMVVQAKFDRVIRSPFGWPQHVTGETTTRSLMNFPAQAGGADMMRITAIAATEAGIQIAAPVHDAFWVLCPNRQARRRHRADERHHAPSRHGGDWRVTGQRLGGGQGAVAPLSWRRTESGRQGPGHVARSSRSHRRVPGTAALCMTPPTSSMILIPSVRMRRG
jgi:hypothetical protein